MDMTERQIQKHTQFHLNAATAKQILKIMSFFWGTKHVKAVTFLAILCLTVEGTECFCFFIKNKK